MAKAKPKAKKSAPRKNKKAPANIIKLDTAMRIEMQYAPCAYADNIMAALCIDPEEKFPDSMGISREAGELVNKLLLVAMEDCIRSTLDWARSAN